MKHLTKLHLSVRLDVYTILILQPGYSTSQRVSKPSVHKFDLACEAQSAKVVFVSKITLYFALVLKFVFFPKESKMS